MHTPRIEMFNLLMKYPYAYLKIQIYLHKVQLFVRRSTLIIHYTYNNTRANDLIAEYNVLSAAAALNSLSIRSPARFLEPLAPSSPRLFALIESRPRGRNEICAINRISRRKHAENRRGKNAKLIRAGDRGNQNSRRGAPNKKRNPARRRAARCLSRRKAKFAPASSYPSSAARSSYYIERAGRPRLRDRPLSHQFGPPHVAPARPDPRENTEVFREISRDTAIRGETGFTADSAVCLLGAAARNRLPLWPGILVRPRYFRHF